MIGYQEAVRRLIVMRDHHEKLRQNVRKRVKWRASERAMTMASFQLDIEALDAGIAAIRLLPNIGADDAGRHKREQPAEG